VLAERIEFVRAAAGERFSELELNLFVTTVALTSARHVDLAGLRPFGAGLSDEQILQLPNNLIGSVTEIAETLYRYREAYGITYFSVLEPHMTDFAKVISHLRS